MPKPVNTKALENRVLISEKKLSKIEEVYEENTGILFNAHNELEKKLNSESKKIRILIGINVGLFIGLILNFLL